MTLVSQGGKLKSRGGKLKSRGGGAAEGILSRCQEMAKFSDNQCGKKYQSVISVSFATMGLFHP